MNNEYIPIDALNRALRYWWLMVLIIIIGALVGMGFYSLHSPIYETRVAFSINIDYVHTGKLSDVEQDHALGMVGDVINSPKVLEYVVNKAQTEGITIDLSSLKQISSIERKFYIWLIRIRHQNPQTSMRLTELWIEAAEKVLDEAIKHALLADGYQRSSAILSSCIEMVVAEPAHGYCNFDNLSEIEKQVNKIGKQILNEQLASQGILSGISYVVSERPTFPSEAITYGRNQSVLVGALIGFIISWWGISINLPERLFKREHFV